MVVGISGENLRVARRVYEHLNSTDYRLVKTEKERGAVFKFRHDAYVKDGEIDPIPGGRFHDDYDDMGNCMIYGVYYNDELASSIRMHALSKANPNGPARDVFPDIMMPLIAKGKTFIDPTRFVANRKLLDFYPDLPYLTVRLACMASEYYKVDYCLATVRREHQAFYKRIFGFELICEPRPYPALKAPISLMCGDMHIVRDKVANRYPFFQSTIAEQTMVFGSNKIDMGRERKQQTPATPAVEPLQ